MSYKEILNYQTVNITVNFPANETSVEKYIRVPFDVDELILKYISIRNDKAVATDCFKLYTDLFYDRQIFAFSSEEIVLHERTDIPFRCKPSIDNTYKFWLTDKNDALAPVSSYCLVNLCFLAVQYKKPENK